MQIDTTGLHSLGGELWFDVLWHTCKPQPDVYKLELTPDSEGFCSPPDPKPSSPDRLNLNPETSKPLNPPNGRSLYSTRQIPSTTPKEHKP